MIQIFSNLYKKHTNPKQECGLPVMIGEKEASRISPEKILNKNNQVFVCKGKHVNRNLNISCLPLRLGG